MIANEMTSEEYLLKYAPKQKALPTEMTSEEFLRIAAEKEKKENKYHAQKTEGFFKGKPCIYDSFHEAEGVAEFEYREKNDDYEILGRQVPVEIHIGGKVHSKWFADLVVKALREDKFLVIPPRCKKPRWRIVKPGDVLYIDFKGVRTPTYRAKARAIKMEYGIEVLEL